ncbi:S-layer homology domain-containing protein [Paenibacillus monticola]|uniref:S-layer homology domain-containing protein n=1 Tax=Paenibacillus monticola TaxID=2666075 RepID=A0A7X2H4E2_9BACL|nr:S-layer homology domain-containing protein [Paenibacillus monticola]MRN53312.1 S-layer homology domain-containing protein [Paenibacillus monticola]
MKAYSTKAISAVLAGAMVMGGASSAFADAATVAASTPATVTTQTNTAATGIFSDVKTGFWAEKHIYKLASQGIVVGNNGLFRPGDSVTQQEAVLMALRFMKLQGNVDNNTAVALPTGFEVSNYYKAYVVLAFQQGLLDKTTEMATDNLKTAWGERKATREWIAEVLIRALGKTSDAAAVASEPTGFADDSKVSASKRGYINTAVDLGLANGLDGNRFDPQGVVTRAQLATFFSRAEGHNTLEYDNTVKGSISEIKDGKLTVYNNGVSSPFNLSASTAYFNSTSETRISLNDVQPYTKVTVIGATYNAAYVEVTDPTPQVDSVSGSFAKLSSGNKIWLESTDTFNEYYYDAATTFVDVNGDKIEPASIAAGSVVTLQRETYSGSHKVVNVQVTSGIVNKTNTGIIQSIDLTAKSITFKNAAGTAETFKWEEGTTLFSSQSSVLLPAELKVNSAVKYTIKDNLIRSVEVTQGVERTVLGSINELTSSTIVYKKADGTKEVKLLGATPTIIIPNITSPVAGDLIADAVGGDNVQLTLNSSDQVTKIEVLSRQIDQFSGAAIVDYNTKTQLLTIMDSSNKPHVFQLDEKTKLYYEGVLPTLSTIGGRLTENRKVNVRAIGQRALSLEIVAKYEGTVTAVNATSRTIVLKLSDGQSVTLPYPQLVDLFGKTSATISDVPIGSAVTAVLSASQEIVTVLKVKTVMQLETATVNAGTNRVSVKLTAGTSEINTLAIPLTNEAGQTIKLSDLKAGDFVNVTFDGSSPLSIQSVKLTSGQVTALDAVAGTLTLKDYTAAVQTFAVSGGVRIIRDATTTTALSNLTTADRVELRKDANGTTIIRVLPQLSRTFSRYDSTTNGVVTKRISTNDNNIFRLAANVYIHQADTTLSVQSLKENDNITVYFNNDVVVEIVKQ